MFQHRSTDRPRRRRRLLGLVGSAALVASLASMAPAEAGNVKVSRDFFGMHDASLQSFGSLHEGSIRLWDAGVTWKDIEVKPGVYDWSRLDQIVTAAQKAHVKVTLVTAMTPHFYRADPTKPPRNMARFTDFLRATMKRYKNFHGKRGIDAYQVWNEANVVNFWTGSPRQMAQMTKRLWDARNRYDKGAKMVAPPMTTRFLSQLGWMQRYDSQRIAGKPVWHYYDVLALNLYPMPTYGRRPGLPEDGISLLALARKRLDKVGVPRSIPIWNTEVNYGLQTGAKAGKHAVKIPLARQTSNVLRTFLLNAAYGVRRVFWYRYDWGTLKGGGTLGNTLLSRPGHPGSPTKAGLAVALAQQWMHGRMIGAKGRTPCQQDAKGTYTCVVKDSTGTRRIYWNPTHTVTVKLAGNARRKQTEYGGIFPVKGGSTLRVDFRPVMVDSHKP